MTRVLAALGAHALLPKPRLAEAAQCSSSVIDGLLAEGVLALEPLPPEEAPRLDPGFNPPTLEPDQKTAADALSAAVRRARLRRHAARRRHGIGQDGSLSRSHRRVPARAAGRPSRWCRKSR